MGGDRFHIDAIASIAMTNTPFFTDLSTIAAARAADEHKPKEKHMEKILTALGLPADATEDAAVAAITQMSADLKAATEANASAQAKCHKARQDAFVLANSGRIGDAVAFRKAHDQNPDAAEAAVAACRAPTAPVKPVDASAAKTPDAAKATAAASSKRRADQSAAVAQCRTANPGMTCSEAEAHCRRVNPELFGTAEQ